MAMFTLTKTGKPYGSWSTEFQLPNPIENQVDSQKPTSSDWVQLSYVPGTSGSRPLSRIASESPHAVGCPGPHSCRCSEPEKASNETGHMYSTSPIYKLQPSEFLIYRSMNPSNIIAVK